jgi:hypothetical protein
MGPVKRESKKGRNGEVGPVGRLELGMHGRGVTR